MKSNEIHTILKRLDQQINDAREMEASLPGTDNSEVLAALKELSYGLGRADQSVARLYNLLDRWKK